ncbi:hypothetical protein C8F04DRAFT_972133, partial [Mycena alexandri]
YSANAWKDYYLDNQERMDIAVGSHKTSTRSSATLSSPTSPSESSSAPPDKSILKKSAPKYRSSLSPAASYSHLPPSGPSKGPRRARKPLPVATSSHLTLSGASRGLRKGRQTINSITAPQPVYSARLPPPNAEIRIPDPPSRSPSPPTEVDGNRYTAEHRFFFLQFISWRLKCDPTLTRRELSTQIPIPFCLLNAGQAPGHTARSWSSYWSTHHDLPDKILASMQKDA